MAARDLPISTMDTREPVGRITINDDLEALMAKGMEFVLSPVLVSKIGEDKAQVIGVSIRALGSDSASIHRAAVIAPNHPVNREDVEQHVVSESKSSFPEEGRKLMADNQIVKEL